MFYGYILLMLENLCINVDKTAYSLGEKWSYVTNKMLNFRVYTLLQTIA